MVSLDALQAALADRYRLDREIGQGGMAMVYRAHDLKHDRDVAIKVLRPELAAILGAERFLSEIKITARLDHPHILTLIDSGSAGDFLYYVLPFVRGESLRARLDREQQLSLDEALGITRQIASALDYAHQHGVIHRDIKPENILLHEGEAVLADFGIALAIKQAAGNRLTETGISLGTPQYMSPEQATGERQLDARSDVYSLAAVLYEMLAGEPPHSGPTVQAIIAKLLTERPTPLRVVRDTVPDHIDAAVSRALAKVPADRFRGVSDFAEALGASVGGASRDRHRLRRLAAVIGITSLVAVASILAWRVGRGHNSGRLAVRDQTQVTFTGNATNPAISADGKQVAYVARRCVAAVCTSGIEVLDLGTGTMRLLVDDVGQAMNIRWSHDRRFLLFSGMMGTRRGSYLVSTLGDNPRPLATSFSATLVPGQDSLVLSLTKARDSVAWVAVATLAGEYRDSVPVRLGKPGILGEAYLWPGGQWIVVETLTYGEEGFRHEYRVMDRTGRQLGAIRVPEDASTWAFMRPGALWMQLALPRQLGLPGYPIVRVPFDTERGEFATTWDTVITTSGFGFDVTEDGQSVVYSEGTIDYGLWGMDLTDALKGNFSPEHRLHSSTSRERSRISPDGTRILNVRGVATGEGGGREIVLMPFRGGPEVMHLRVDSLLDLQWMPDGRAFSYAERVAGAVRLVTVDVRTGRQQGSVVLPDPNLRRYTPVSDGGWAWTSGRVLRVHLWRSGERGPRVLSLHKDETDVLLVSAAPDQLRLASIAEGAILDSIFLDVTLLPEGPPTRWATFRTTYGFSIGWLADRSLAVWNQESEDKAELYRVTGPGRLERLGTIPRGLWGFSLSRDGKRVALDTRDFRGDVWLAHLKRTGGN